MRKQKNVPKFGMKKFLIQNLDPKKIPYFMYILGAFRDETLDKKNTSYFTLEITFFQLGQHVLACLVNLPSSSRVF
jgi:uncharacterized membrane protein YcfT